MHNLGSDPRRKHFNKDGSDVIIAPSKKSQAVYPVHDEGVSDHEIDGDSDIAGEEAQSESVSDIE